MSKPWNPLQDLMLLQDRMNRLFEEATARRSQVENDAGDQMQTADWYPPADVYNNDEEYLIAIDLPGVDRSTMDISIDGNQLTVKGTRVLAAASPSTERPSGSFVRTFSMPENVNRKEIHAEYKDGVLQVQLPRRNEQKAKRIEIKVS